MANTERLFTLKVCDDRNTTLLKAEYLINPNCLDNFLIANTLLDNYKLNLSTGYE